MKVADTKIMKEVKDFLSEISVSDFTDFNLWVGDTLKGKDQKKSDFGFSFCIKQENFPDMLNKDDSLKTIKGMIGKRFKKEVRYLKINISFAEELKSEKLNQFCNISFEVKLA